LGRINCLVCRPAQARIPLNFSDMEKPVKKKAASPQKRIFLVEDHPVFREGLAKLLHAEPDLTVCGEAGDARVGLKSILKLKPDLAVVDLSLPGKSGLEATGGLHV